MELTIMSLMKRWRAAKMISWAMVGWPGASTFALAAPDYQPITPTLSGNMITLTGHDLTIEQVIDVAPLRGEGAAEPGCEAKPI
jgi:hypothetical protein